MIFEINQRLYIAITSDTTDQDAEGHFNAYLDKLYPSSQAADQKLKQKFLASGLQPPNFEIPIRVCAPRLPFSTRTTCPYSARK